MTQHSEIINERLNQLRAVQGLTIPIKEEKIEDGRVVATEEIQMTADLSELTKNIPKHEPEANQKAAGGGVSKSREKRLLTKKGQLERLTFAKQNMHRRKKVRMDKKLSKAAKHKGRAKK